MKQKARMVTEFTKLCSIRIPHELLDEKPEGLDTTTWVIQSLRQTTGVPAPAE